MNTGITKCQYRNHGRQQDLPKLRKTLRTGEGNIKCLRALLTFRCAFCFTRLYLARVFMTYLKSSDNKTFEELKSKVMPGFCLEFKKKFSRLLSCRGLELPHVVVGLCAQADGLVDLRDFPAWQLYPLVCICYLSISRPVCSFSLNKKVYNS